MNYKKIYDSLIDRGKIRLLEDYTELHHITPRCLGGSDDYVNLVRLTPEEHYLAHLLLVKIYPNNLSLVYAAQMMIPRRPSNKMYGWLRRRFAQAVSIKQSGSGNSQYKTRWINDGSQSLKIKVSESIPDGFVLGRAKKIKKYKCEYCQTMFNQKTKEKFCTSKCKTYFLYSNTRIIDENLENMIQFYLKCNSIDRTVKKFGIVGKRAGSAYFSEHLKKRNIKVLNRRNSSPS